jgi:Tol biopolymer transport system component/DNA-binding winged helix-turn-helix (wHTH) protein
MSGEIKGLYVFGSFRLDEATRTLTHDGEPVPLAPKTFDLLTLMVGSEGRLLSKEQLMRALWDEAFVEEGNLTYQVSTLRKALAAEGAAWVETVPKSGYRFRAPVVKAGVAKTAAPDPDANRRTVAASWPRTASVRKWLLLGCVIILVPLSMFLWRGRAASGSRQAALLPRALTTFPGSEVNPSFSPDGSQVAFQWNGADRENDDIYVMSIGAAEPLRLTRSPEPDLSPSWSPDGRLIAFVRRVSDSEFDILLVPPTGGRERKLSSIHSPFGSKRGVTKIAWTPDSRALILGDRAPGEESTSLFSVPLSGAAPTRLTRPPEDCPGDMDPAYSPDGGTIAFVRQPSCCQSHVMLLPSSGGDAKQIAYRTSNGPVQKGLAWTADGKELIWAHGGQLWRVPINGGPLVPIAEAGRNAVDVAVSRDGKIIYAEDVEDVDIWSLDLTDQPQRPKKLISSTRTDGMGEFSPDGKSIAFASDRSGAFEIWVTDASGSNPLRLTYIGMCGAPRWSNDGQWIAFDSAVSGNSEIYIVSASGGRSRRITNHAAEDVIPTWSPDGQWIYFTSKRTGTDQIWRIDVREAGEAPDAAVQITRTGAAGGIVSADGRYLYFVRRRYGNGNSLLRMPLPQGSETTLVPAFRSSFFSFSVTDRGVYYDDVETHQNNVHWKLMRLDPRNGSSVEVADLPSPWKPHLGHILAASPDGLRILLTLGENRGSDLMLLEGIR